MGNLQLELLSRRGKPFQAHSVQLDCPANQRQQCERINYKVGKTKCLQNKQFTGMFKTRLSTFQFKIKFSPSHQAKHNIDF